MENIKENVKQLLKSIEHGNCFNEKITLVAATKMQSAEKINEAINSGITDVGENWVQEFKEKYDDIQGGKRHFIGHLQTNKVKYLIGKTDLYQSLDRIELADEISKRSKKAGIVSNVLIQINIGNEESKSGFDYENGYETYKKLKEYENLKIQGFMAMLPISEDEKLLISLIEKMRALYDKAKETDEEIKYLSMGMSGDYKLCIDHGSNMIRVGTTIFGHRNYQ